MLIKDWLVQLLPLSEILALKSGGFNTACIGEDAQCQTGHLAFNQRDQLGAVQHQVGGNKSQDDADEYIGERQERQLRRNQPDHRDQCHRCDHTKQKGCQLQGQNTTDFITDINTGTNIT